MLRDPLIKTFMVLMAAVFFTVQGFSQAHAAANGGLEHTHEGVACEVTVIAAEHEVLSSPPALSAPVIWPGDTAYIDSGTDAAFRNFDGRAPPPRGPPL